MDWKSMPEGKEKYQAYLCSREWGLLKEAVRQRCQGVCERCCVNRMDHTHHLTYARKYRERLEDLTGMCKQCHEFTHGKSDKDPAVDGRVLVAGKFVKTFYLAGKITGTDWRDEIVADWSEENHSPHNWNAMFDYENSRLWRVARKAAAARNGVMLDYAGPWWSPACGGHASASWFSGTHAYFSGENFVDDPQVANVDEGFLRAIIDVGSAFVERSLGVETPALYREVRRCIDNAIHDSDLVFAWIDTADCFGTLVELGIAAARRKAIIVAFGESVDLRDFWLAASYAHEVIVAKTAGEAWAKAWGIEVPIHSQEAT
jgi:hypothetical protein